MSDANIVSFKKLAKYTLPMFRIQKTLVPMSTRVRLLNEVTKYNFLNVGAHVSVWYLELAH